MSQEFKFDLTGKKGIAGVATTIAVLLFVGLRAATIGESDDPDLIKTVKAELMNSMGGNAMQTMENIDTSDPEAIAALMDQVDLDKVELHAIKVSKPFLSMSTNERVIIFIDYTLPGDTRAQEYWRMRYATIGGWQYRARSTVVSYYLNFM